MRKYSQVDAFMPFIARPATDVPEEQIVSRAVDDMMTSGFSEPPTLENEKLEAWLSIINAKLDAIMRILTLKEGGFTSLPVTHVKISGGGITYNSMERINAGEVVEMKMLLPGVTSQAMLVYGKVTEAVAQGGGFSVNVEFVAIDENLRDQIIDFVFRREREILREKREEGFTR